MTFVIIALVVSVVVGLLSFVSKECVSSLMKDEEKTNSASHREEQIV